MATFAPVTGISPFSLANKTKELEIPPSGDNMRFYDLKIMFSPTDPWIRRHPIILSNENTQLEIALLGEGIEVNVSHSLEKKEKRLDMGAVLLGKKYAGEPAAPDDDLIELTFNACWDAIKK